MKKHYLFSLFLFLLIAFAAIPITASAEGSVDLTENGGYRPYIEAFTDSSYASGTEKLLRQQIVKVYAKAGETIYFGSSVADSDVEVGNDITLTLPDGEVKKYDVLSSDDKDGFIENRAMETAGAQQLGNANGYNAFSYVVTTEGIYTFTFHSKSGHVNPNESKKAPVLVDDSWDGTQGSCVAAWDVTVADATNVAQSGRVYSTFLSLNMGGNKAGDSILNSTVYILTADGYIYETDFNGMDPYGFLFFSNNRGLLDTVAKTSVYHSSIYTDNAATTLMGKIGFALPDNEDATETDLTYRIFFNKPDSEFLSSLGLSTPKTPATVSNFKFHDGSPVGRGEGGTFTFDVSGYSVGSSFQIKLDFGTDNVVYLSNAAVKGANSISWDGRDAKGAIAEPGSYTATITMKAGEYHFPLGDVENCPNGIKITLLSVPSDADAGYDPSMIYYDNSDITINKAKIEFTTRTGYKSPSLDALSGISSTDGNALKYTNNFGDMVLFDAWTYYYKNSDATSKNTPVVVAASGSIKVTNTLSGNAANFGDGTAANPGDEFNFTITLKDEDGNPITTGSYPYTTNKATPDGSVSPDENGQVSFTLKHGEEYTLLNLPFGTRYTVVQTDPDRDNYATTKPTDSAGTLSAAASNAELVFENTRNTGTLAVSTSVTGTASSPDDVFTYTVTMMNGASPATGTFAYTGSASGNLTLDADGKATFTLKGGESINIAGIFEGIRATPHRKTCAVTAVLW